MDVVLGIDGGGTKTVGIIADVTGKVLAEVTVGATNPNSVPKEKLHDEFLKLFTQLKRDYTDIFNKVRHVFAGLSGADHLDTRKEMNVLIQSLLPLDVAVTVDNDAITALYSGTLGNPGIVQIAGTGAITYGVNAGGERRRLGGWGYLFSDQGSGYSIGRDALQEVFLTYDGLGRETLLTERVLEHFKVEELPDLIRIIYQEPGTRKVIASLSKLVMEAADAGDRVALDIIGKNGHHLGKAISTMVHDLFGNGGGSSNRVRNQSNNDHMRVPVILAGGLFNRLDLLEESIGVGLGSNKEKIMLTKPTILPVGGAIIAAFKQENVVVRKTFNQYFSLKS